MNWSKVVKKSGPNIFTFPLVIGAKGGYYKLLVFLDCMDFLVILKKEEHSGNVCNKKKEFSI